MSRMFAQTPNFGGGRCLSELSGRFSFPITRNRPQKKMRRICLSALLFCGLVCSPPLLCGLGISCGGSSGFANNTCAMDNWATYNSTEGADNDRCNLFTAVQWWMYLYMVIDGILILGIFGIGGFLVVGSCLEKEE